MGNAQHMRVVRDAYVRVHRLTQVASGHCSSWPPVEILQYVAFPIIPLLLHDFTKCAELGNNTVLKKKRVAVVSAKNHKRQRRKRQSVTAQREKSQTPKALTAILTSPNLT